MAAVNEDAHWAAILKNSKQTDEEVRLGVTDYLLPYSKGELEAMILQFDQDLNDETSALSKYNKTEEPFLYFIRNCDLQWRQLFLWNLTNHEEGTIVEKFMEFCRDEEQCYLPIQSVVIDRKTKTGLVTFYQDRGALRACQKLPWSHYARRGQINIKNAGGVKMQVLFDLAHVGRRLIISNMAQRTNHDSVYQALLKYVHLEDIEQVYITQSQNGATPTCFVNMRSSRCAWKVLENVPLTIDAVEVDVAVAENQTVRNLWQ